MGSAHNNALMWCHVPSQVCLRIDVVPSPGTITNISTRVQVPGYNTVLRTARSTEEDKIVKDLKLFYI